MLNNAIIRATDDPAQAARFVISTFAGVCPPQTETCQGGGCLGCWTYWLDEHELKDFKLTCEFTATFASDRRK